MRISDWSSDVCSSDLINPLFSAFFQPFDAPFEDGVDQSILAAEVIGDHHFVGLTCRGTDLGEGNARIASAGEEPLGSDHQLLRSEEHTSALQSLMRISYAVFCLKKKKHQPSHT